jgi:cell division protein FtsB
MAGVGFFILVMLVTSFFGKNGYMDIYRARKSCRALEGELQRLEEQKKKLELEIRELETDPGAVEKEAREKLWLMKPDEKVIVIKGR